MSSKKLENSDFLNLDEKDFSVLMKKTSDTADALNRRIRIAATSFSAFLIVAYAALELVRIYLNSSRGAELGSYIFLLAGPVIILLFLFDPKTEEQKKYKYETDRRILIGALRDKIKLNMVRFAGVLFFGVIFTIIQAVIWIIILISLTPGN